MENKYCPLLSITEGERLAICQRELCAWYVPAALSPSGSVLMDGRCAVQDLGVLPYLAEGVRRL